jgi:membrane dipeptidase
VHGAGRGDDVWGEAVIMSQRPSRRDFLTALTGAMLPGPNPLRAAEADPRVAQIVARTIGIDMHSHVQVRAGKPAPGIELQGEMKRSGFSAICQTYNLDAVVTTEPGGYYRNYLQSVAFEDELLARNHMRRALTMKDLLTAHQQRRPVIVQAVEGAQFIEGRLPRIEEAYKSGLRHLQLVHEQDDPVAPLGDVYTAAADHLGGLTSFGAEVIGECNRLGIVVDLAHGTAETVRAGLKAATQPLLISHTGLSGPTTSADMQRRLISKELAREVAEAGGVIGVWWRLAYSTKEYVAAIKDMASTVGVDHVGIGTDTDLTASYLLPYTNKIWADENGGFFYAVVEEMLRQGFTPDEISRIGGGNFCRVFAKVTSGMRG